MARRGATVLDLIGDTPIVRINKLPEAGSAAVWGKMEYCNPLSSVKDRICLAMVESLEEQGKLRPGGVLVEPTSGNTGIGLAMVAAVKGYRLILTMPDTMSVERRKLLKALGAEIVLTPGKEGMKGAVANAEKIVKEIGEGAVIPQQFENPANPGIHRRTTAVEILEQMDGKIDAFVAGVGTGGTLTGVGEALKEKDEDILVVAVEPENSAVLSGGSPGPHRIQGIGAGFVPGVLNTNIIDRIIRVTSDDAFETSRRLAREEGVLTGISAGANVFASLRVAKELGEGKDIVTILCDTGERYLSTDLFDVE
ncbi:MAG: cysteine synthase A [Planctomycetes bacterium]|nr:cysteine synthase A [Planctomycetota bacterium]